MRRLALAEMQLLHSQIAGSNFMIALGDADGPAPAGVVYADVPIPTPRPDYPPHVAEGDD
jgi:hypothetical protein